MSKRAFQAVAVHVGMAFVSLLAGLVAVGVLVAAGAVLKRILQ